jgi:heme oxygenase
MSLKDLTWEKHQNAERKSYAKKLMSGKMTPQEYHRYLHNQFIIYTALETQIDMPGVEDIFRSAYIDMDLKELEQEYDIKRNTNEEICPVTWEYVNHVQTLDQKGLLAHLYVRHFGDMYGGAMIAKRIPGSGKMYQFENKQELIAMVREKLDDSLADEANKCFDFAIKLFEELEA